VFGGGAAAPPDLMVPPGSLMKRGRENSVKFVDLQRGGSGGRQPPRFLFVPFGRSLGPNSGSKIDDQELRGVPGIEPGTSPIF
jgi:hypothetical protein